MTKLEQQQKQLRERFDQLDTNQELKKLAEEFLNGTIEVRMDIIEKVIAKKK